MHASSRARLWSVCAVLVACSLVAPGCGVLQRKTDPPANAANNGSSGDAGAVASGGSGSRTVPVKDVRMDAPPKLTAPLLSSDVLV